MKTTSIRLPDGVHEQLKAAAERERRSLNAQIIWYLETGLRNDQQDRSDSPPP